MFELHIFGMEDFNTNFADVFVFHKSTSCKGWQSQSESKRKLEEWNIQQLFNELGYGENVGTAGKDMYIPCWSYATE